MIDMFNMVTPSVLGPWKENPERWRGEHSKPATQLSLPSQMALGITEHVHKSTWKCYTTTSIKGDPLLLPSISPTKPMIWISIQRRN